MPPRRSLAPAIDHARPVLWVLFWELKAWSTVFVSLVSLLAVLLPPSDASVVARAISSHAHFPMPALPRFVERSEMSVIVDAVEQGQDYVVLDGGHRVGKSVAVEVAASRLSATRTVCWSMCDEGDTAGIVLRRLYGLDTAASLLARIFPDIAKLLPLPLPPSVADVRRLALTSVVPPGREPIFVVEMAERLEVKELKLLLDFAKVLVDKRHGRFVFVFSPTDKLESIRSFGSLSRAKVVHVGDLNQAEAASFLASSGCTVDQSLALYALVGGHLPYLVSDSVRDYCRSRITLPDVEGVLFAGIGGQLQAVNRAFGSRAACTALCGVFFEDWPKPVVLEMLLKEHLIVAALTRGVSIESQAIRSYVHAKCTCRQ